MTVHRLLLLLSLGKAELIDKAMMQLYMKWMRPKDVKRETA